MIYTKYKINNNKNVNLRQKILKKKIIVYNLLPIKNIKIFKNLKMLK